LGQGRQGAPAPAGAEGCLDLSGTDSRAVLEELAAALARAVPGGSAAALARELREREALGPTALGGGVAVPHCRVRGLARLTVVIGRHAEGVEFGAPDGVPVRLFVAVAAPAASPAEHLRLLARLARLLRDRSRVTRLLEAEPADGRLDELVGELLDEPRGTGVR
jgi:PTS system nitrogen regulatory IIA component